MKHQGDLGFAAHKGKITGKKVEHTGSVVLALGEKTGHKHIISVKDPNDMTVHKDGETFYITIKTEAEVTHNQHGLIKLAPGIWKMGHEREVDWFQEGVTRTVVD